MRTSLFVSIPTLVLICACGQEPEVESAIAESIDSAGSTTPEIHKGYSETSPLYEVDGNVISNVDVTARLWNPRGKTPEQIAERAKYLTDAYDLKRTPEQQARAAKAREKYRDAVAVNAVMIGSVGMTGIEAEHFVAGLERNKKAGISLTSVTAFAYPSDGPMHVFDRQRATLPLLEGNTDFVFANSTEEIREAKRAGKLAVIFNTQGADYAIEDLAAMETAHELGIRVSNFTYNNNNALAGGGSSQDMGVTDLGRQWVEKAQSLNIVMDCSHSSNQACIELAEMSDRPIIASHSPAHALNAINRNITDEAMQAIASTDGVICTTGVGFFLNAEGDASPEEYAKHVNYTGDTIGRDKTCFSTDYMHNPWGMFSKNVENVDVFPPEKGFGVPAENTAAEHIWDVAAILEDEYGWSDEEIRGFLGENLLRVYEANWK